MAASPQRKIIPFANSERRAFERSKPLVKTTLAGGQREFPLSKRMPAMASMTDEVLDYYGWVFCQGGFRNLQMTFEQFLTVVAVLQPSEEPTMRDLG